jgi:predicted carbohydrate-binding protein with CBM5 and CBM33 domain
VLPERTGVDPLPAGPDGLVCSAKGCTAAATTDLQWNNPKIHAGDRRKHWLACDEHRTSLGVFLSTRGFLRDTLPL